MPTERAEYGVPRELLVLSRARRPCASARPAEEDVRRDRRRFEERRAALAAHEAEREVQALTAAGTPMSAWPLHTAGRRQYEAFQREAESVRNSAPPVSEVGEPPRPEPDTHEERGTWWSRLRGRIFR
jgi:hypothetical protein